MTIGDVIKEKRESRQWSQNHLANKAKMSQPGLRAIEIGESSPTYSTLEKIAKAFGCKISDLTDEKDTA